MMNIHFFFFFSWSQLCQLLSMPDFQFQVICVKYSWEIWICKLHAWPDKILWCNFKRTLKIIIQNTRSIFLLAVKHRFVNKSLWRVMLALPHGISHEIWWTAHALIHHDGNERETNLAERSTSFREAGIHVLEGLVWPFVSENSLFFFL